MLDDSYFSEAIFAIQNDFDHASNNSQYGQLKIPEMINIVGHDSFENEPEIIKGVEKEMNFLFLNEKKQLFFNSQNFQEDASKIEPDFQVESENLAQRNESNADYDDEISHLRQENNSRIQFPFQNLTQRDFRSFSSTHFLTFF